MDESKDKTETDENGFAETDAPHTDSHEEEVDEELLALAPPPPGMRQVFFILVILAFSILILVLFFPELRYFAKGFDDPVALGEASDVDLNAFQKESYVSVEGLPLVNRTLSFSTGAKWFSGDIFRKMAPLSGQPNLLVQWSSHNPDIRQLKDTMSPPAAFAGRLKHREDLGRNYDKFWPFHDCLQMHSTSRCKYCIGRDNSRIWLL